MGQPLPLPERIPRPNAKTLSQLESCGIQVDISSGEYVNYTLPSGWRMVDNSWRQDLPEYYILDTENKTRFSISGSWKGTYDNELSISVVREPELFKPRTSELIPSETDDVGIMCQIAEKADPLHRPSSRTVHREADYVC